MLLRFAHGSGVDGLSGMAALRETGSVRFLRPLLSTGRDRLRAFLTEAGQPWIEDPSNQSPAYARARLRGMAEMLSGEGWSAERAADTARRLGRARSVLEFAAAGLAAAAVDLWPEGCVLLRPDLLRDAEEETALRLLSRCLAVVGGARYRPKLEAVERLYLSLREGGIGRGRTLGGCRIMPYRDGRLLIAREPDAADERADLAPGATIQWDGRFMVKSLSAHSVNGRPPGVASRGRILRSFGNCLRRSGRRCPPSCARMAKRSFRDFDFLNDYKDRNGLSAPAPGGCPVQTAGTFDGIRIRSCLKRRRHYLI